ncbi:TetR/AcrR family transcriptional regulator [Pseudofrankia inefficax]|uniref:Regulatory protein TetR n=1 Tax=Pseudofrankia inefficax (strain DSM 45817 / CECT 9037 / DDB 130130 / EuI1c) TaxID=298654 RepID=E3JAQ1_PSEI1|nr:TetR/AcrR family transcriptional regulator [Pseudofrankia inefficax]ADP82243.1 regulatory protein TetR [Pseudofrankia inefficax]
MTSSKPAVEPAASEPGRRTRPDARRNRLRVLAAAESVFSARGTSVSTEEVARSAGVGVGTVFRHFPTKEALLEAVFVARMRRFAEEAQELVTAADPGDAFFTFLHRVVDVAATKATYADALATLGTAEPAGAAQDTLTEGRDELPRALGALLARAQQASAVREDVTVAEVSALLFGACRIAEQAAWRPDALSHTLDVVFDGLRPAGRLSRAPS